MTELSDLEGIYVDCHSKADDDGSVKRKVPAKACVLHSLRRFKEKVADKHRRELYPSCRRCKIWQEQVRRELSKREGVKIKEKVSKKRRRKP